MGYLQEIVELTGRIEFSRKGSGPEADYDRGLAALVDLFLKKKATQSRVFFIGNGGSAAIASHMTADYLKNGGMRVCSLYNASVVTCLGNDYGYEHIFSRQLEMMMGEGDLLVAISSSGNSPNIVGAIGMAQRLGGDVVTFTGFQPDNQTRQRGDFNVYVPSERYGMVESLHNLILQQIVDEMMGQSL